MNKREFIENLRKALNGLPKDEVAERLSFYSEMIDDRMEDGLSEEEAVSEIGQVDEIASQIVAEFPLAALVKERIRPRRKYSAWEITLLVLGFPVWFPVLAALFVSILSVYIVIWAVVVSLWAAQVALAVGALGGAAEGILLIRQRGVPQGLILIGLGLCCAGLSVFLFFACKAVTKGCLILTRKIALVIKSALLKKEKTK